METAQEQKARQEMSIILKRAEENKNKATIQINPELPSEQSFTPPQGATLVYVAGMFPRNLPEDKFPFNTGGGRLYLHPNHLAAYVAPGGATYNFGRDEITRTSYDYFGRTTQEAGDTELYIFINFNSVTIPLDQDIKPLKKWLEE